jgi:hypothetical protein
MRRQAETPAHMELTLQPLDSYCRENVDKKLALAGAPICDDINQALGLGRNLGSM